MFSSVLKPTNQKTLIGLRFLPADLSLRVNVPMLSNLQIEVTGT